MWQAIVVVLATVVVSGLLLRGWGRLLRRRARARLGDSPVVRELSDVTFRVLVQRTGVLPGMSPRAANRTRGDVVLTADRLLVVCNRGILIDLLRERGRGLRSARATGPGKLVIEGDVARPGRSPALWRVEVGGVDDVRTWVERLVPWVRVGDDDLRFGSVSVPQEENPG